MNSSAKQFSNRRAKARKRKTTAQNRDEESFLTLAQSTAKSAAITLGIGAALLLTASLAIYFYSDPILLIRPIGLLASALTAFLGGIVAIRVHKKAPLLCGLLNGCAVMVAMMILSLFFRSHASEYPTWIAALIHAAFPLLCVLGAMVGGKRSKPHARRHR